MDKFLRRKLENMLRCEGTYVLEHEKDKDTKVSIMNDIFNMEKIVKYYDELEPLLIEFFEKKVKEERWKNSENQER